MRKNGIFDIDGGGESHNPEILRPLQNKAQMQEPESPVVKTQEQASSTTRRSRRKKAGPKETQTQRHKEAQPKPAKSKPRAKWKNILWAVFILLTAVLAFFIYSFYTKNDSSFSKLILNFKDATQVSILIIVWILLLTILLFISNKKVGTLFLITLLTFANFSAFKANEIVAGFQKLFDNNASNTQTAIKTSTKNILTEPFTVLVLGVDADDSQTPKSSSESGSGYRSDTMILVTVNPKTHKADMITTPRDTFLYDSCTGGVHKLTEFIGSGVKCTIDTIESLYNVKIDYFVQANFNAVVQVVDALGGIEVNVPDLTNSYIGWLSRWISLGGDFDASVNNKKLNELLKTAKQNPQWCDVDSRRNPYSVCFTQFGTQTVNGEQALAFARSRHYDSDYARGIRQTDVIRAIVQKMATPAGLLQIQPILEKLRTSYSIETNMTFQQMTDIMSYSESLSGRDTANFQVRKYQPLGADNTTYTGSGIILYRQSIVDIRKNLAITLETAPPAPVSESEYYDTIEYPSFKTNGN